MHFRQVPRLVISFGQVQMECARSSDEGVLHWWPWQPSGHWSFPLVKRRSNSFKTGPLILQPPNFLNVSPSHCSHRHPLQTCSLTWQRTRTTAFWSHTPHYCLLHHYAQWSKCFSYANILQCCLLLHLFTVFCQLTISGDLCALWGLKNDSHTALSQVLSLCKVGEWG